jgi:hypothetical protein
MSNPAEFAENVRRLAQDAFHALRDPGASVSELMELSERVDDLRRQRNGSYALEVDRWLRSAGDQLRCRLRSSR